MSLRLILLIILLVCFRWVAHAEVRMFDLRISKRDNPQDFRLVKSSLDPLQYPGYHPLAADEIVTYDSTWKCQGHTGNFRAPCSNPKAQELPSQGPENAP